MAVPNAVTTLLANLSVTNVQKVELIDQTGVMTATMTMPQKQKPDENLTPSVTMTTDGIDELEELEFDDFSEVDYDLDYTVQY